MKCVAFKAEGEKRIPLLARHLSAGKVGYKDGGLLSNDSDGMSMYFGKPSD